jgi:23S rRNA pseudouridine955/2504/2580 synthase
MVAKRRSVLRELHAQLRAHSIDKRYLLLVQGVWRGGGRRVDLALARDQVRGGERIVRVAKEGQEAATRFTPLELFEDATLMRARPLTGRTHQIRVHAAALGHRIAGDSKYGDPAFDASLRVSGLRRLFLHAGELRLTLPGGDPLRVEAPLGPELEAVLDELRRPAAV